MNVLIVCGGTGGHLFPGIAVGEELLERRHQVLLVVSEKEIDQRAVERSVGFLTQTLPAVGWGGWRPDRLVRFTVALAKSVVQTRRIFRSFHPEVILGMGGFSSVAPLLLAWKRGLPSCIHESNAIAGKANRLAARLVSIVAVGFAEAGKQFSAAQTVWTGTPVRAEIRKTGDATGARQKLGLAPRTPVVLVVGGSQGAHRLNQLVVEAASQISPEEAQWLHLTGIADESRVRKSYVAAGRRAVVRAFCHEMADWYAAADLVIARAGASSLAEIAARRLPSILIPYPFAAERHQSANGRHFAEAGAAVMWEESDCSAGKLAAEVRDILTNKNRRKKMSDATEKLGCEDSHRRLAEMVEELARKNPSAAPSAMLSGDAGRS